MGRKVKLDPGLVVGYARASTSEQLLSAGAQRDQISDWCEREGLVLVAFHSDEGVSGTVPMMRREGLQCALSSLKERRAGVLAVTSVDRLSREQLESMKIRDTVRRMGAAIAYVAGQGIEDTSEARAMTSMLAIFAELERDYISGRTKAALQSKRRAGARWNANAPFGMCWRDGVVVACDDESRVLEAMRTMRREGMSYEKIARAMNEDLDRFPCRGVKWHTTSVWRALNRV